MDLQNEAIELQKVFYKDYKTYWEETKAIKAHLEARFKALGLYNVSKSLPTKDVEFIYSLHPDWVKNKAPEGLDPTMYGTLSKEGDDEVQERVKQILGNVC